jgi:hypothetical protein
VQLEAVMETWCRSWRREAHEDFRPAMPCLPSSPGSGKTHMAGVLARGLVRFDATVADRELEAALARFDRVPKFVELVREAVGVTVTFGYFSGPLELESADMSMLALRMLLSHFLLDVDFRSFVLAMKDAGFATVSPFPALQNIQWDDST